MSISKASEYFGLFLTEIRNSMIDVPLSDLAVAIVLRDALEKAEPDDIDSAESMLSLSIACDRMIGNDELADDNGDNPWRG